MDTERLLHIETCLIITLGVGIAWTWWGGALVALLVGVAKEGYDEISYAGWDWKDLASDVVGIVIGLLILLMI